MTDAERVSVVSTRMCFHLADVCCRFVELVKRHVQMHGGCDVDVNVEIS